MFKALLGRLEETAENAVSRILARALVFVPFLIAAGFATAAATTKLTELYGDVAGYGLVALAFLLIGLLAAIPYGFAAKPNPQAASEPAPVATATGGEVKPPAKGLLANSELVMAAAASLGQGFIPTLARALVRNLPLLAAMALIVFVLYGASTNKTEESVSAAE